MGETNIPNPVFFPAANKSLITFRKSRRRKYPESFGRTGNKENIRNAS